MVMEPVTILGTILGGYLNKVGLTIALPQHHEDLALMSHHQKELNVNMQERLTSQKLLLQPGRGCMAFAAIQPSCMVVC